MITRIPITITLRTPFATRDNSVGGFGIDLPLARNAKNQLMLAGTHVLGKIFEATRELSELLPGPEGEDFRADLRELHAEGSQVDHEKSTGREARRNLGASDFVCEDTEDGAAPRTRIARDNVTGVVAEGMMQVIEQPFAVGREVSFKGELRLFGEKDKERHGRLLKAIEFITQMGGLRTIGFGEVVRVSHDPNASDKLIGTPAQVAPDATRLQLRLRFADPFCAGEARNSPNTYVSAGHVPGGVIKGAIARQVLAAAGQTGAILNEQSKAHLPPELHPLVDGFAALVVRHGVPVARGAHVRPRPVPDSLAVVERPQGISVFDLAALPDPHQAGLIDGLVPTVRPDWKDKHFSAADQIFGKPVRPERVLRIRTQIDRIHRAAQVKRLFGIEYTCVDDHDFLSVVEVPPGSPAGIVAALAQVLKDGLSGIGRGGAFAEVTLTDNDVRPAARPAVSDTRAVLTLASLTLLRRPESGRDLRAGYAAAFSEIGLPRSWKLTAVFARERLAGGGFFRNRRTGTDYRPWLLTEPGATFVFDRTAAADPLPNAWFDQGLSIPAGLQAFYGLTGQEAPYLLCPYLPQNGYGELTLPALTIDGAAAHEALKPVSWDPIDLCAEVSA